MVEIDHNLLQVLLEAIDYRNFNHQEEVETFLKL